MADKIGTKADRSRIKRLHQLALGYQPFSMKPVHLATSFLLALVRRYRMLELLNKAANPVAAEKRPGDQYVAENLYPIVRSTDSTILRGDVGLSEFKLLRQHLNAALDNDGALNPSFAPRSSFGSDYSTPSLAYLTNGSKNHGHAGAFLWLVFNESEAGQCFLRDAKVVVQQATSTAALLGAPFVEEEDREFDHDLLSLCGDPSQEYLSAISRLMASQTEALGRLARHLLDYPTAHALRHLIIAVGSWLLIYQLRHIPSCSDTILFADFAGASRPRVSDQAAACYARHLGLFGRSLHLWLETANDEVSDDDRLAFELMEPKITKALEDHFRELSVRIGWVQPRSGTANKYFRPQPDTIRVLLMSILNRDEVATMDEVAERLRNNWRLVFGLLASDHAVLRKRGYAPLDEDTDLRANRQAFKHLAIHLGLAWEPSDGLVLFSLNRDTI
jgi:hypothetical protein